MYKKFQALLEKRNETVYQVSKETGISQTAFSNWKSGRTSPNIDSLKKLSKHFNVPIEYFVGKLKVKQILKKSHKIRTF